MMAFRHIDELDTAVRIADRAIRIGHLEDENRLAGFLYHRWYLGRPAEAWPPLTTDRTWQAWSPHWTPEMDGLGSGLVRLYLTCAPNTAPVVVGAVTERARTWAEPWLFSSSAPSVSLPPVDSTVLCLPIASLPALRRPIQEMLEDLRPLLATTTPALTLRIAPGAALAQNPPDGRDFGESRCRVVARSVLSNMRLQHRVQVARTTHAFSAAGIDPERPYRDKSQGAWDRPWRMF